MPTRSRRPAPTLVDTSAAIALLTQEHAHHSEVLRTVEGRTLGLAGHAAFETYSVMTRLPSPGRRPPAVVAHMLSTNFPETRHLSGRGAAQLLRRVADLGIAGGAMYDALVAATAVEHGAVLVSRDRRAVDTYRALGADVEFVASPA